MESYRNVESSHVENYEKRKRENSGRGGRIRGKGIGIRSEVSIRGARVTNESVSEEFHLNRARLN